MHCWLNLLTINFFDFVEGIPESIASVLLQRKITDENSHKIQKAPLHYCGSVFEIMMGTAAGVSASWTNLPSTCWSSARAWSRDWKHCTRSICRFRRAEITIYSYYHSIFKAILSQMEVVSLDQQYRSLIY